MAAHALQLPVTQQSVNRTWPLPDRSASGLHGFMAYPAPDEFQMQNPELKRKDAYVLYYFDLTSQETSYD